jgi:signal peptidase I
VGDGHAGSPGPAPAEADQAPADQAASESVTQVEPRSRGAAKELAVLTATALVIAILLKTFVVQAFYIPSVSMEPTLRPGDRILINRVAYRFGDIERGDIVVFSQPHPVSGEGRGIVGGFLHWLWQGIGVVRPDDDDFIKRVIGLPGDVVEMHGGIVSVNGRPLDEPYVNQEDPSVAEFPPTAVPDGMLFVMGDNRNHSGDSRFPPPAGLGFVPIDKVIGQAFVVIWPPSRVGWLH